MAASIRTCFASCRTASPSCTLLYCRNHSFCPGQRTPSENYAHLASVSWRRMPNTSANILIRNICGLEFIHRSHLLNWPRVIGWHGPKTFVLPGRTLSVMKNIPGSLVSMTRAEAANYSSGGTSKGWKMNVAELAPGNDYLVFGISFRVCRAAPGTSQHPRSSGSPLRRQYRRQNLDSICYRLSVGPAELRLRPGPDPSMVSKAMRPAVQGR